MAVRKQAVNAYVVSPVGRSSWGVIGCGFGGVFVEDRGAALNSAEHCEGEMGILRRELRKKLGGNENRFTVRFSFSRMPVQPRRTERRHHASCRAYRLSTRKECQRRRYGATSTIALRSRR